MHPHTLLLRCIKSWRICLKNIRSINHWPTRYSGLTFDWLIFLWSHIKEGIYLRAVDTREKLWNRIQISIRCLNRQRLSKSTTNKFRKIILICLEQNGTFVISSHDFNIFCRLKIGFNIMFYCLYHKLK